MARLLLILAILLLPLSAQAKVHETRSHTKHHVINKHIISIVPPMYGSRASAILMDADTGKVLQNELADEKRYPASLTKMMTLYLAFDAIDSGMVSLNQVATVSAHAAHQSPSIISLRPNDKITIEDLILAIVTKSANDAAVTLGETLGGNETNFARMMTEKAAELGMRNTVFRNASGLPNPQQHTTAYDMATLGMALWKNHRQHYHYFATPSFAWRNAAYPNHNHILEEYQGADGIKTGFINQSGFNLVASASREGKRLIGVVFGGNTFRERDEKMIRLLDYGFQQVYAGKQE